MPHLQLVNALATRFGPSLLVWDWFGRTARTSSPPHSEHSRFCIALVKEEVARSPSTALMAGPRHTFTQTFRKCYAPTNTDTNSGVQCEFCMDLAASSAVNLPITSANLRLVVVWMGSRSIRSTYCGACAPRFTFTTNLIFFMVPFYFCRSDNIKDPTSRKEATFKPALCLLSHSQSKTVHCCKLGLGFERFLAANTTLDRLGLGVEKIPSGSTGS